MARNFLSIRADDADIKRWIKMAKDEGVCLSALVRLRLDGKLKRRKNARKLLDVDQAAIDKVIDDINAGRSVAPHLPPGRE